MNEIEKLYENVGIENKVYSKCTSDYCVSATKSYPSICKKCSYYQPYKYDYPPFTAEKQIEIVKFLLKKAVYYDVKDDKYWFYWEECESAGYKPFDEAIAHFINKLWQDLTEEEKEQIRGILNG